MSVQLDGIIDFHTHTLLSDGALVLAEHVRRAEVAGYSVIGIADHIDSASIETVVPTIAGFAAKNKEYFPNINILAGAELTHVPPKQIDEIVRRARELGAGFVIVHGETRAEPVAEGTNMAAIKAGCDILAHPGFLTKEEAILAREKGVYIEITHRKGHSITNGFVAKVALEAGASLIVNSDTHRPDDFLSIQRVYDTARGAGLSEEEYQKVLENSRRLAQRIMS